MTDTESSTDPPATDWPNPCTTGRRSMAGTAGHWCAAGGCVWPVVGVGGNYTTCLIT